MKRSMSSMRRRGWQRREFNCFFEYTDKRGQPAVGKGRKYEVDGVQLELFPSPVLCAMLGRELKTLYGWEKDWGFPSALWQIREDTHCKRWYSRRQLVYIRALYEAYGRLKGKFRPKLAEFIAGVNKRFYTVDEPVRRRENECVVS